MITLFGATGYTGRLVAGELATLVLPPGSIRLAGRSQQKLEQLAQALPYEADLVTADAREPTSLPALFKDTQVLINCVGPFTDLGNPVVAMAALHGCHYLDTTNELGFVHSMRSYHKLAADNQAAIVPACGFEVALADCAAALLAEKSQFPLISIDVVYALSGGNSSLGSRRSAIRSLGSSWLAFRGGDWVRAVPCSRTRWVALPQGRRAAISFPSSETAVFPKHLPVAQVETWLVISRRARHWAKFVLPLFARMARTPLAELMGTISAMLVKPPENHLRTEDKWLVQVEADSAEGRRSLSLTGKGVYEITAKTVVYAASQILNTKPVRYGVLAPSAVLQPDVFIDHIVNTWGCKIVLSPSQNGLTDSKLYG